MPQRSSATPSSELIKVEAEYAGKTRWILDFKLELRYVSPKYLERKIRSALSIRFDVDIWLERYSHTKNAYVVLKRDDEKAYKLLQASARGKKYVKIRVHPIETHWSVDDDSDTSSDTDSSSSSDSSSDSDYGLQPKPEKHGDLKIDISSLVDSLGSKKTAFFADCTTHVEIYVRSQGAGCLAVNEMTPFGPIRRSPANIPVLFQFLRGKRWDGHRLESALSERISEIVSERFSVFISNQTPTIIQEIQQQLLQKVELRPMIQRALAVELAKHGVKPSRSEILKELPKQLHTALHSQIGTFTTAHAAAIGHSASTKLAVAAATPLGHAILTSGITHQIAHQFTLLLSHKLSLVLTKVVASAAFKKLILAAVNHSLSVAVTSCITSVAISHIGLSKASLVMKAVAFKLLAVFIVDSILSLPDKLAVSLGEAVREQLEGNFRPWTHAALETYVKELANPQALAESILTQSMDKAGLGEKMDELVGFPSNEYPDVRKNVASSVGLLGDIAKSDGKRRKR